MIRRFLCWLGIHGPDWYGNDSCGRSSRVEGFVRRCEDCGAVWYGREVETRYWRTLGGWERQPDHIATRYK